MMQLDERQINASIVAMVMDFNPNFWSLSDAEKTSLGQATWWWFSKILARIPEGSSPNSLFQENSEVVRDIAADYLVGAIKQAHAEARKMSHEDVKKKIATGDIDLQSSLFMRLGKIGLQAAADNAQLQEMVAGFEDIDFDLELQRLLATEG